MGRRIRIFSDRRNQDIESNRITIKDEKIETIIKNWLEGLYWKFSSLESILEQTGISLPAVLSDFDSEKHSFICTDSEGKEHTAQILFKDNESYPKLSVADHDEERIYELRFNFYNENIPKIYFVGRKAKLGNKTVTGYYSYFYNWKVEIGDSELIKVSIRVPGNFFIDTEKCKKAEEYLLALELNSTIDIRSIFNTLIDKLSLSSDVVERCKQISITYSVKQGEDWIVKSKINAECGFVTELQIYRQCNIYHLFSNGNWEYIGNDGIKITSDDDVITVTITGNTDKIASINLQSMLQHAEYEINLLWGTVW